jgi:hypothetical protein
MSCCSEAMSRTRMSSPLKRESTWLFATTEMDARFRGHDGEWARSFPLRPSRAWTSFPRTRESMLLFATPRMTARFRRHDGEWARSFRLRPRGR